jgi:hypothetical protein
MCADCSVAAFSGDGLGCGVSATVFAALHAAARATILSLPVEENVRLPLPAV